LGTHPEAVKVLLENGADVNAKDNDGGTALMWAARRGYVDVVVLLLVQRADVNSRNKNGETALMWAAREGNPDVVNLLKAHGAKE
jgi:ankyrin repeat protein